ncbi:carboxylesterase/lipase family protein [Streptomyces acidicola]|uniref:carboxylesterase/lipase family protein n=1 Tax=Streptomyces acidicola TaxID=2596892 RepID=UPI003825EA02
MASPDSETEHRASAAPVVRTADGPVRGDRQDGTESFRSIPYAAPPTGSRRFKPPVRPAKWTEVRSAARPGPACVQTESYDPTENGREVQSEDCLSLNVWTPKADGKKRPVMVFIHGGAFGWGSARNSFIDGAALAKRGDAVVVTIQYRLGAFGFTEMSQFGEAFNGGGNAGILDQISALRWVRQNIGGFGGDRDKVTVFGQSAGGESVRILLGTPQAKGLFQRAMIVSGINNLFGLSKQEAIENTAGLMKAAKARTPGDLQKLDAARLAELGEEYFSTPHMDGHAYPKDPTEVIAEGGGSDVPLVIGTTRDEIRYWTAMTAAKGDPLVTTPVVIKNVFGSKETMKKYFGNKADEVVAGYRRAYKNDEEAVITFLGDGNFRISSIRIAEKWRAPVYMYRYDYSSPVKGRTGQRYGAAHTIELPFVFGNTDRPEVLAFTGPTALAGDLRERTMDAWVAFARTGDPSTAKLNWPRYDTRNRTTMIFDKVSKSINDPDATERKAWADVPFSLLPYRIPFGV